MKHNKSCERYMFNQMKPRVRVSFGFPYFNHFLKYLQRYTAFNILRYHGPYPGFWEFDRLDAIVCCFYVFPREFAGLRTEIIVWLLKVEYLLQYFR